MTEETKRKIQPNLENYVTAKTADGKKTRNCGDDVAEMLTGKTLDETYDIAAQYTGDTVEALHQKYDHLNAGLQRMSLGARIRGAINKAEKEKQKAEEAA